MRKWLRALALCSACSTPRPPAPTAKPTAAATAPPAVDTTAKTVAAANAFLATLDDAERAKVTLPFDSEQKAKWSNFPVGMVPRNGVRWGDLNTLQRQSALQLLATVLSKTGLDKVRAIMEGDEILKVAES